MPAQVVHSVAGIRLQKPALCLSLFFWLLPQQILGSYYVSLPRSLIPGYPLDISVQITNAPSPVLIEASLFELGQSTPVSRTINTVQSGHPQRMQIHVGILTFLLIKWLVLYVSRATALFLLYKALITQTLNTNSK
ncbi:uncharacterized protein LOC127875082 [Dreissena polymorpha]|uniref:uncharacterized protein LOC127875082 n=1 Tax=Dreissena polymorpha TaxID=45954 RepID=UPI0022640EE3|nr:uncharacterized protein LOC127875082 [Dreissena polymorpha]